MLNFGLVVHDRYCLAHLGGLVSFDGWEAVLQDLASSLASRSTPPPRLVLDMTAVVGYLGVPERRAVGALMARYFGAMEKVAIVVQAQKITDVVHTEAQHNGLNLRLFPEHADAVAWATA